MRDAGKALAKSTIVPISLVLSVLLIASVAGASFLMLILKNDAPLVETRAAIAADLAYLKQSHQRAGTDNLAAIIERRTADRDNTYFYAFYDPSAALVVGNLNEWSWDIATRSDGGFRIVEVPHNQVDMPTQSTRPFTEHYDVMMLRHVFDDGHVIYVGRNIDELEVAYWIARTFGWAMVGSLVLILIYIFWFSFYVVSAVRRFSKTATQIVDTGDLSVRIPQDSKWDDLGKLAITWNGMLDEIQSLVTKIQDASNNIAHDLRTPLTRMRLDLENVEDPVQREELMREADTLLGIVNGLLRIVEIETGAKRVAFSSVALHDILGDVVSFYGPVADDKEITLTAQLDDVTYFGDRDLLFQAFMNVIDNALKFTPRGGQVSVKLQKQADQTLVAICDSGPGIPEADLSKVFERFYRRDQSRTTPGYGLGLSVVHAVADLHNAQITLAQNTPGLCFNLALPNT